MLFLHSLDSPKLPPRLLASFFPRQPCRDSFTLGKFQMSNDLAFQLPLESALPESPEKTSYRPSKIHGLASRNRATKVVVLSQFATSRLSCFDPAFVSE